MPATRTRRNTLLLLCAIVPLAVGACSEPGPAPDEMDTALDDAFAQRSRLDRIERLSTALQHLDKSNVEDAVRVFDREHWWLEDTEIRLFMESWARFDPEAALDFATNWPLRERRPEAIGAALRGWALRDPQAAQARFATLAPSYPRIRSTLVRSLLTGWVESGQPGLLAYLSEAQPGAWPYNAMVVSGTQTRLLGATETVEWAEGVMSGEYPDDFKKEIFRRVTGMASRLEPQVVAPWVEQHNGDAYADRGPNLLVERWVVHDPEAAMQWASSTLTDAQRLNVLRGAFTKWLVGDLHRASAWIEAAPLNPRLDPAYLAYANVLAQRDPETAVAWAGRVHDERLRLRALERASSAWYRRNSEAAEAWLTESPLEEDARERVRSAPSRRPARPLDGL